MAGSFSDYLENELLDHVFKTGAYTPATNIFIALLNSTPTDADTGTTISTAGKECTGGAYARVTCNAWDAAAAGAIANTAAITFAQATDGNWGQITHFAICDSATAGNMLAWADLTAAKTIDSGDTAQFAAGDLDVTLT